MSQTIENRIVEMQFENKQFESGVQESLSTLDKLKKALNFKDAEKNLTDFGKQTKNFNLNDIGASVEKVSSKFSAFGAMGFTVMQRLTNSAMDVASKIGNILTTPMKQIKSGGWKRAMNIEEAKFQLEGLEVAWDSVYKNIDDAVSGTAFSFDAAAKACAQFAASGVQAGDDMAKALRAISGVAAMGNTEYENIADIFTKAAGNGKVMADELNRISQYGLNARATLKDFYNDIINEDERVADIPDHIKQGVLEVTKGLEVTESDIADFASKSKINFETFYRAMDLAFGEHAKKANETFSGSLRNINAALSRTGQKFAEPLIQNAIPVFNKIREIINAINAKLGPFQNAFKNVVEMVSGKLVDKLGRIKDYIESNDTAFINIYRAIQNITEVILKFSWAFKTAFAQVFGVTDEVGDGLTTVTGAIEKFTKMLIPSKETTIAFKNILVALFNILKAIGSVVKALLPGISKILSVASKIASILSNLVVKAIDFVSRLNLMKIAMTAVQVVAIIFLGIIDRLIVGFNFIKAALSDTTTVTGQFAAKVKDAVTTIAFLVGGALYSAFTRIKSFITGMFSSGDPLGFVITKVENLISKFKELNIIETIINKIKAAFSSVVSLFTPVHGAIDKTTDCVKTLVGATEKGEKVIEETFEMTKAYGNGPVLSGVAKELTLTADSVENTSNKMTRAQKIFKMFGDAVSWISEKLHGLKASSVVLAIFAMRLVVMAYNTDQLIVALGGLARKLKGGLFNFLRTAPSTMAKFTAGLLEITAAITLIALAIHSLKDVPTDKLQEITKSLMMIVGLAGGLALVATAIGNLLARWGGTTGFASFGINLFMMSASLITFIGALKLLDSLNLKDVWQDVRVLVSIMGSLAIISALVSLITPKLSAGSLYMISFSLATLILVKALDNLSDIDFSAIKENWKELIAVLLGFAAVAAIASTVGIGSLIGLITFFVGFTSVAKVLETLKIQLKGAGLGDFILEFCSRLKNTLSQFLTGLREVYEKTTEVKAAMLLLGVGLTAIINLEIIHIMNTVTKSLRRITLSVMAMAASIALLMYAIVKMTQAMEQLPSAKIEQAKWTFIAIAGFLTILAAFTAFTAGDKTVDKSKKGLKDITKTNRSSVAKNIRKMLLDMAALILSISAFMYIIGKLTPEECMQAERILWEVMGFLTVMMGIVSLASISISKGKGTAGFGTFIGIIALFGTMIASFVVLMNYFKDFSWENDGQRFTMVIVAMVGIAIAIGGLLKVIGNMKFNGAWAIFASFALVIGAIGGVAYHLIKEVKKNDLKVAKTILTALGVFILELGAIAAAITWLSRGQVEIFSNKTVYLSLLSIAAVIAAIGGIAYLLIKTINKGNIKVAVGVAISLELLLLTLLGICAVLTEAGNTFGKVSVGFGKTMAIILGVIGMIAVIAGALWLLKSETDPLKHAGANAINAGAIIAVMGALIAIAFAVDKLAEMASYDPAAMGIAVGIITVMSLFFLAMTGIFKIIDSFATKAGQILGKSQTIILSILELIALAAILTVFGEIVKTSEAWLGAIIGGGFMIAMEALFVAIVGIFKLIDSIKADPKELSEKARTIKNAMWELIGLFAVIALVGNVLGEFTGYIGALGAVIGMGLFTWMEALFAGMAAIFLIINKINVDGMYEKSRVIRNVMWELIAISTVSIFALLGLPGLIPMATMTYIFKSISETFTVIDGIKVDGLYEKSRIIRNIMWEFIAISTVLGLLGVLVASSVIGAKGMITLAGVMVEIGRALNEVSQMGDLNQMKQVANDMVELLWILTAIGAVNGLGSGFVGQGLESLAAGIVALGSAMTTIPAVMDKFSTSLINLSVAITAFCATGGSIKNWLNDVSTGITDFCGNILGMITGFNNDITSEVSGIIDSIKSIIFSGKQPIYDASVSAGSGIKEGLTKDTEDASTWGLHVIESFASGISTGVLTALNPALGSVASAVAAYLRHTNAEKGEWAGGAEKIWGLHTIENFCSGILDGLFPLRKVMGEVSNTVKDGITQMYPGLSEMGQKAANYFGIDLTKGLEQFIPSLGDLGSIFGSSLGFEMDSSLTPYVDNMYSQIYGLSNALASLSQSYARGLGTLSDFEYGLKARIKESEASTSRLETAYNKTGRSASYLDQAIKNSSENTKKLKDQLSNLQDGWKSVDKGTEAFEKLAGGGAGGGGKGKGGGGIKGATEALDEFQKKLEETLEGQMNIFQKFEKKDAMSKDELLENMRSQIKGMTEWATQMQVLSAKGLDEGLYQELALMGPQGAEYVGAFAQMTAEELQEANALWAQSLVLPKQVAGQVAGAFNNIGKNVTSGLIQGVQAGSGNVQTEMTNFANNSVTAPVETALGVQSPSRVFAEIGGYLMRGLANGIKAHGGEATTQIKAICAQIVSTAKSTLDYSVWHGYGINIIQGLIDGLNDEELNKKLNAAITALNTKMQQITTKINKIESPSKVYYGYGKYIVEGLANGIRDYTEEAVNAVGDLSYDSLNSMKETIAGIGQMLVDEVDDPVIKPVLDLSNVQAGARTLNNMFSATQALNASASLDNLQNEQLNGSRLGTTFIQNNYSPKALSRTEIYRQTKNQFSAYREAFS